MAAVQLRTRITITAPPQPFRILQVGRARVIHLVVGLVPIPEPHLEAIQSLNPQFFMRSGLLTLTQSPTTPTLQIQDHQLDQATASPWGLRLQLRFQP